MKNAAGIVVLILGMLSVARAADISTVTVQGQIADWSLIQSKGGMQVGLALQHTANSWQLPLVCDLSGGSSGLLIQKTIVKQEGKSIFISLALGQTVWTLTPERGKCKPITLESTPGLYQVFYRNADGKTHPIGFAEFNIDSEGFNKPSG